MAPDWARIRATSGNRRVLASQAVPAKCRFVRSSRRSDALSVRARVSNDADTLGAGFRYPCLTLAAQQLPYVGTRAIAREALELTMVSAGELHVPGLDYEHLTAELVTSLAVVTRATTGRVRWSGVKVHAGTVLLIPGMKETHFDRLAAAGTILAKFLFFPLSTHKEEALQYTAWCRARGIRTKVHTGGVSRSGLSHICGYEILAWLQPDIAAHVSGGPIPMSDADLDRVIDETSFALEICSSGNYGSTQRAVRRMKERGQLHRLVMGTDTPGGTGVIPRGMLRQLCFLCSVCGLSPGEAIAVAAGNTARAHGLDVGVLAPGRVADLVICGPVQGSAGTGAADAIAHGDLPGIAYVLVEGKPVVSGRSRQTPPPHRKYFFSCCEAHSGRFEVT